MEKLWWVFWLEKIGILLLQFYTASGSISCACIAWFILLFTNSFVLVTYFSSIDGKVAELAKTEQENHNPMQDQKARQEVETESSKQELVPPSSDKKTDNNDSSDPSGGGNEGWEVLDPAELEDAYDPKSPKPSDNQDQIESDNSKVEEVLSTFDPINCEPIESNQDDKMPTLEDCIPVCYSESVGSSQDHTMLMLPGEKYLPVSYSMSIESSQDSIMLEDCYPFSEKLKSKIDKFVSKPKRLLIDLLLEGNDDVAIDRKQVKELIEYLLEKLINAEKEAEHIKSLSNSYNPLLENTLIEEHYSNEFDNGEEDDEKKKKWKRNQQSDEGHDCPEERKKWQEEFILAKVDTVKASEAELEQKVAALEQELRFLRTYYQDRMNHSMAYQQQDPPPLSDLNVLHLEHHVRELSDQVVSLNKDLEYERWNSDYYKQQRDEYRSDLKYMNQAYQDLQEKYDGERKPKDHLV